MVDSNLNLKSISEKIGQGDGEITVTLGFNFWSMLCSRDDVSVKNICLVSEI